MKELHIDAVCPTTNGYNLARAEKVRQQGGQVWSYICLGPRYPYANWMIEEPLIEARVLIGWQAYHQKMDGFLYWGLNIWSQKNNDRPIDPAQGPFLDWSITSSREEGPYRGNYSGDGKLLYPGPDGPIGSIRLANIRDGFEDYDYLSLLAECQRDPEAVRRECLPVTQSLTEFTRDPAVLLRARETVARQIEGQAGPRPPPDPEAARGGG